MSKDDLSMLVALLRQKRTELSALEERHGLGALREEIKHLETEVRKKALELYDKYGKEGLDGVDHLSIRNRKVVSYPDERAAIDWALNQPEYWALLQPNKDFDKLVTSGIYKSVPAVVEEKPSVVISRK